MPHPLRNKFRQRLDNLFQVSFKAHGVSDLSELELMAHWAKYLCVLTSGYLEQSFKESLISYTMSRSSGNVTQAIDKLWPKSKNLKISAIVELLEHFSKEWKESIEAWLEENPNIKADINGLVQWRNDISHGNDANTTGVTHNSVKVKYDSVNALLDRISLIISR